MAMKEDFNRWLRGDGLWRWGGLVVALLLAGFGGYYFFELRQINTSLEGQVKDLTDSLWRSRVEVASTTRALVAQENRNNAFYDQVSSITSQVGVLDKLSKTDKELLQKYSKVYFLNENYVPKRLTPIDVVYVFDRKKNEQIVTEVWPHLASMLFDASSSQATLRVISSYRSFDQQMALKSSYKVTYGQGANRFSADQGYSEHQLGTALDFTTPGLGSGYNRFEGTAAYRWLTDNAYHYGFVLSYPKNNKFYQYEPWHWRYVGVALASRLHTEGKYFYDLSQREIDPYLVHLFD